MILIFDTETTGLPLWREPSDHPGQPHLVEIAALLFDEDGNEAGMLHQIIRPDGWTIPAETAAVHGITTERALEQGFPEDQVLDRFLTLVDQATLRVAHNQSFDARIIRIALKRFFPDRVEAWETTPRAFCTANATTKLCDLAPTAKMMAAGFRKAKTPKLSEAYQHLFGEELQDAHSAMADARACARVFFELKQRGLA